MFQRTCNYLLLLLNSSAGTNLLLFLSVNIHCWIGILLFCLAPAGCQCDSTAWQCLCFIPSLLGGRNGGTLWSTGSEPGAAAAALQFQRRGRNGRLPKPSQPSSHPQGQPGTQPALQPPEPRCSPGARHAQQRMQLGQAGKSPQGSLHLRPPESRVGAHENVSEGDEISGPWEKPWEGDGRTEDEELSGSMNEPWDADVTMSFKWRMKSCVMCMGACYERDATCAQSALRIACPVKVGVLQGALESGKIIPTDTHCSRILLWKHLALKWLLLPLCCAWHLEGRVGNKPVVNGTGCCSCWPFFNLWVASLLALCSFSSPVSCPYPEQLEPGGSLEATYCQYSSQGGICQLSQFCPPGQLASNVFSRDHLPPPTPLESRPVFPDLPGSSGAVTYGATQGYAQNHPGGPLMQQQPSGNSGKFLKYFGIPLLWSN